MKKVDILQWLRDVDDGDAIFLSHGCLSAESAEGDLPLEDGDEDTGEKPYVDWQRIPQSINAICKDPNGSWVGFSQTPVFRPELGWVVKGAEFIPLLVPEAYSPEWQGDPENSLVLRPQNNPVDERRARMLEDIETRMLEDIEIYRQYREKVAEENAQTAVDTSDTLFDVPGRPLDWLVRLRGDLWLVPAAQDGWGHRRKYLGHTPETAGYPQVSLKYAMGCGIPWST